MTSRLVRPAFRTFRAAPISVLPISTRQFTTSSPRMTVHNLASQEQFKEAIAKNKVVILDAFAEWCGPCKAIAPQIAKWAQDPEFKDKIYFAKFDVDALPELAAELGIRAMPTFLFFKDGEKVDEVVGANPPLLQTTLRKHNPGETQAAAEEGAEKNE
ncbi:hypothetical protein VTK26DRAFT_2624 [Humicola hyalothermophila]